MRWLVERIIEIWGGRARWEIDQAFHPYEAHTLKLDCSKAKLQLGWLPQWDLENSLKKTVEWYKAYRDHVDLFQMTLSQIQEYGEGIHQK